MVISQHHLLPRITTVMNNDITVVYIAIVTLNNNECCDVICRLLLL
jgi:hypothetical protein